MVRREKKWIARGEAVLKAVLSLPVRWKRLLLWNREGYSKWLMLICPILPPPHPSVSFSPLYFLKAYIFSSPFICQFLTLCNPSPADLFRNTKWNPLALLTCIKRLHSKWGLWKWLPLRRCQGTDSVNMQTVHSIYPLSLPHVMWPDLSDDGVNKMKGVKEGYRLKRPILILKAPSRWQKEAGSSSMSLTLLCYGSHAPSPPLLSASEQTLSNF